MPLDKQRTDHMKILIASTPATGHLNPLLAITRILLAEGHEIAFLTGTAFRARIESSGVKFFSLPAGADFDLREILSVAPELKDIPPGLEWFRVAIERIFVDAVPAEHQGLLQALQECQADVIVGDDMFFGVLPMLLDAGSRRPPIVLCAPRSCIGRVRTAHRSSSACRRRRRQNNANNTQPLRGTITRRSIGPLAFA